MDGEGENIPSSNPGPKARGQCDEKELEESGRR